MKNQKESPCRKIVVLDTSAFLAGFDPFALSEEQVTVPSVEEEIIRNSIIVTRFRTAIESGKIKVRAPRQEFLDGAKVFASKLGDSYLLSKADTQLLALALELKAEGYAPQIVTDDYSIQNVATKMGVEFLALATFGIKRLLEWIRYCPACHKEYPPNCATKECLVCGTQLKRKPRRTVKNVHT
jgi:endoribonuclease Nob1